MYMVDITIVLELSQTKQNCKYFDIESSHLCIILRISCPSGLMK